MSDSKNANLERLERRRKVAHLYLQRMTQTEIARRLGVKQPVVSRDLRRIRREWSESTASDFASARQFDLRKFDLMEQELWGAWERSKEGRRTAQITKQDGKETTRSGVVDHPGNPRYIDLIGKITALRRALFGPGNGGSSGVPAQEEMSLSERRERILAVINGLRGRPEWAEARSGRDAGPVSDRNEGGETGGGPAVNATQPSADGSR